GKPRADAALGSQTLQAHPAVQVADRPEERPRSDTIRKRKGFPHRGEIQERAVRELDAYQDRQADNPHGGTEAQAESEGTLVQLLLRVRSGTYSADNEAGQNRFQSERLRVHPETVLPGRRTGEDPELRFGRKPVR